MTETPTTTITDEQALLLAKHATFVQGGFSTPEIERERIEHDIARGAVIGDAYWARIEAEIEEAMVKRRAVSAAASDPEPSAPSTEAAPQEVNVTAVLVDIDMAKALRARLKELKTQLDMHEQQIKDVMGGSVNGVDSTGTVVVTLPFRNRTNLIASKVKEKLSPEDYAACQNTTTYRTLLFE